MFSGLFLVAFYMVIVLVCIPVCYVQMKLGALFKRGIVGIFSIVLPILKGIFACVILLLTPPTSNRPVVMHTLFKHDSLIVSSYVIYQNQCSNRTIVWYCQC